MQKSLFDKEEIQKINDWEEEWIDMPEYNNSKLKEPLITATFKFRTQKDFEHFNKIIKIYLYEGEKPFDGMQRKCTKSTWYPLIEKSKNYVYINESKISGIHNK